ncbi:MAG TPA: DUF3667 domain-containing protein [Gammaproteobacteria bacterium]|nr:DUF3667 domain-containing protein [Gammaproteobacteria bacterium]
MTEVTHSEGKLPTAVDAAGDAPTRADVAGADVAGADAAGADAAGAGAEHAKCLNCGAALLGKYCSACGQPAHLHRTLASLGHDVLHAVLHFDGKLWRTIPELAIFPGRLTRRYIDGERTKFVSPMALYLFTVFLMYAVFSLAPSSLTTRSDEPGEDAIESTQPIESAERGSQAESPAPASGAPSAGAAPAANAPAKGIWTRVVAEVKENPSLVSYKLKTNGYKYSWLLVPLSIPFMWLLFFWRRDITVYDHAVFVTYSISFMMWVMVAAALAEWAGAAAGPVEKIVAVVAAVHMYRQLRGAYGLSRAGAAVRLFFLLIAAGIVLIIFLTLMLLLGALH